jgi:hypothetical protein
MGVVSALRVSDGCRSTAAASFFAVFADVYLEMPAVTRIVCDGQER